MSKNIFITGTGTDIGKTYISALLVKYLKTMGFKSGYYKAAASGNKKIKGKLVALDAKFIKEFAGINEDINNMVSYVYEDAVSPHLAAVREKIPIEMHQLKSDFKKICKEYDYVTVEGSGGIICPLRNDNKQIWLEDVIKEFNLSAIIVTDAKLGSINAAGLTASYMREKGIPIKGIIINNYNENDLMEADNKNMIEKLCKTKILACVKHNEKFLKIKGLEDLYE